MAPNKQLQMIVGMLSFFYSYASNKNYYGTPYCTTFLSICITIHTKACNNNIILNNFSLVGDLHASARLIPVFEIIKCFKRIHMGHLSFMKSEYSLA